MKWKACGPDNFPFDIIGVAKPQIDTMYIIGVDLTSY